MTLELRVERFGEEHIEPYVRLSRAEYGDHAAVSQENHLRWKFMENPQGPSVGIHLYKDEQLVGRLVAMPRDFLYRGRTYKAAYMADLVVEREYRGMLPLLQLMQGLKQLSGFDFIAVTPNPAGAEVWEKFAKMPAHFDLAVAALPLRPARVQVRTRRRAAATQLSWSGDSAVVRYFDTVRCSCAIEASSRDTW